MAETTEAEEKGTKRRELRHSASSSNLDTLPLSTRSSRRASSARVQESKPAGKYQSYKKPEKKRSAPSKITVTSAENTGPTLEEQDMFVIQHFDDIQGVVLQQNLLGV